MTLDAKGRFAMPARYREGLIEQCRGELVTTVDRDYCLLLYPLPTWEEIAVSYTHLTLPTTERV